MRVWPDCSRLDCERRPRLRPGGVAIGRRLCQFGATLGLHPGATPEAPGVQKGLVLRGFLEAVYYGGEGGIRTPDRLAPMPHFECGAFDHSATSPGSQNGAVQPPRSGRVLGEDGGSDKARRPRIPRGPVEAKGASRWSI